MLKFKLNLKLKQYKLFGSFNAIVKVRYVPLNKDSRKHNYIGFVVKTARQIIQRRQKTKT